MVLVLLPKLPKLGPNRIVPPGVPRAIVDDPRILHLVTVLFVASFMNRMVLVTLFDETVVFETVSEDPATNWPSIVTLSAPLKLINGLPAAMAPDTVRAPTALIVSEFHETEGSFKTAGAVSTVSQVMETVMLLVFCAGWALIAANASRNVT
jgi:hypothetical protein